MDYCCQMKIEYLFLPKKFFFQRAEKHQQFSQVIDDSQQSSSYESESSQTKTHTVTYESSVSNDENRKR